MSNSVLSRRCLLAFLIAAGCGEPERRAAPSETPAAAASTSAGAERATAKAAFDRAHHMQASLWLALSARESLTQGDLTGAKDAARALATHDYEGTIPDTWQPGIDALQKHAGDLAAAGSIDDATQALAAVALRCGHCHYEQSAGPNAAHEPPVEWRAGPDTLDQRMARHAEGAEQMWIGLVEPSNEAWRSGTLTLTHAPLAPPSGAIDTRAAQAIERVRFLARRARTAVTYPERGLIYGQLIATCGHCHGTAPRAD